MRHAGMKWGGETLKTYKKSLKIRAQAMQETQVGFAFAPIALHLQHAYLTRHERERPFIEQN